MLHDEVRWDAALLLASGLCRLVDAVWNPLDSRPNSNALVHVGTKVEFDIAIGATTGLHRAACHSAGWLRLRVDATAVLPEQDDGRCHRDRQIELFAQVETTDNFQIVFLTVLQLHGQHTDYEGTLIIEEKMILCAGGKA